jgi:phosphoglycerate dehydrogenase-like enzyme
VLVGDVLARLDALGEVVRPSTTANGLAAVLPDLLESVDVCLTGWGTPPLPVIALGPDARLRLVAHTAGAVRHIVPVEAYARGIQITHAAPLLADAVAECTLLLILEGLRRVGEMDRRMKDGAPFHEAGNGYQGDLLQGQRVGLVGAGYVGRRLIRLLAPFSVDLSVYDPYLSTADSGTLGVHSVDLDTVFAENRIVSIHAPSTPETQHMIGAPTNPLC